MCGDMPTCLFIDNQSTIKLVHNLVLHARTKHIEILCHFTRKWIDASDINIIMSQEPCNKHIVLQTIR
jgi:hypothetical protein